MSVALVDRDQMGQPKSANGQTSAGFGGNIFI